MFKFYEALSQDQLKGFSRAAWSLRPLERLVKVVSSTSDFSYVNPMRTPEKIGYVTQEYFLIGKTAEQIERELGLSPFELRGGAKVFALERLPSEREFEFRYFATMPGGKAFDAKVADEYIKAKHALTNPYFQKVYPPGGPVLQWEVLVPIPLKFLRHMIPHQQYAVPGSS